MSGSNRRSFLPRWPYSLLLIMAIVAGYAFMLNDWWVIAHHVPTTAPTTKITAGDW